MPKNLSYTSPSDLKITILMKGAYMGKGTCTPPNGPSTTGHPSGKGRGNCPSK